MMAAIWLPAAVEFAQQPFEARLAIAHRLAVHFEHVAQLDVAIRLGRPHQQQIRSQRARRLQQQGVGQPRVLTTVCA